MKSQMMLIVVIMFLSLNALANNTRPYVSKCGSEEQRASNKVDCDRFDLLHANLFTESNIEKFFKTYCQETSQNEHEVFCQTSATSAIKEDVSLFTAIDLLKVGETQIKKILFP